MSVIQNINIQNRIKLVCYLEMEAVGIVLQLVFWAGDERELLALHLDLTSREVLGQNFLRLGVEFLIHHFLWLQILKMQIYILRNHFYFFTLIGVSLHT